MAITLPGTTLLLGTAPVDSDRVTWEVQTHDPARPDAHHPQVYGEFTWTALRPEVLDRQGGVFRLPDGSALDVADGLEPSDPEPRYRIASRVEPGRLIPATETWADLAAIERIAVRVHSLLSPAAHPDRAGDGRSVGAG